MAPSTQPWCKRRAERRKYRYSEGYAAGRESPYGEDVNFSDTRTMARARRV